MAFIKVREEGTIRCPTGLHTKMAHIAISLVPTTISLITKLIPKRIMQNQPAKMNVWHVVEKATGQKNVQQKESRTKGEHSTPTKQEVSQDPMDSTEL